MEIKEYYVKKFEYEEMKKLLDKDSCQTQEEL